MLTNLNKFNLFIEDRNNFSYKTFGSPQKRGCLEPLNKLKEELTELMENPDDESEWADCLLCFLDAAWRKGYSFDDLLDFSVKKLEINKKRKWIIKENGNFQHE